MKPHGELCRHLSHIAKFEQKVALPEGAIVFAVGDQPQPDVFLQPHDVGDRVALDARKLGWRNLGLFRRLARGNECVRPDQAADVLGAEWRFGRRWHGSKPPTNHLVRNHFNCQGIGVQSW